MHAGFRFGQHRLPGTKRSPNKTRKKLTILALNLGAIDSIRGLAEAKLNLFSNGKVLNAS